MARPVQLVDDPKARGDLEKLLMTTFSSDVLEWVRASSFSRSVRLNVVLAACLNTVSLPAVALRRSSQVPLLLQRISCACRSAYVLGACTFSIGCFPMRTTHWTATSKTIER